PGLEDMTPYEMSRAYPNLYNQVGHYLNIIDPDSTTTGFAVAGNGQMIQGQVMDTPGLPLGTVNNGAGAIILDEGRKMTVQDYIADVQSRTQLAPDIQAAYDEALAQLEQAREQAQAALEAHQEAQEIADAASQEASDALAAQQEAGDALADAIATLGNKTEAADDAQQQVTAATTSLTQAQQDLDEATTEANQRSSELAAAESDLDAATIAHNTAAERLEDAKQWKQDADQRVDRITNAQEFYDQAVADLATAQ